jgi:hypothetical protein
MAVSSTIRRRSRFSARESASSWGEGTSGPSTAGCRGGGGGRGGTGCVGIGPAEGEAVTLGASSTRGRCGRVRRAATALSMRSRGRVTIVLG